MANEAVMTAPASPAANGTGKGAAAPAAPQFPRVKIPDHPVSGREGAKLLEEAITYSFLPAEAGGETANSELRTRENGQAASANEPAAVALPTEASELAELTARAAANGVLPEEQHAAEVAELDRLTKKAQASGKTVEQIAAEEDAAAAAPATDPKAKTFTQDQVEGLIKQRVTKLAEENAQLRQQLASGVAPLPAGFEAITDPAKLAQIEAKAQEGLAYADDLLAQLAVDPDSVAAELGQIMGRKAEDPALTPAEMMKILRDSRAKFRKDLQAVPQRKAWLAEYAKGEALAPKLLPFLADASDERTVLVNRLAAQFAPVKQIPAWRYWLGCAVAEHQRLLAARKAAGNANGQAAGGQAPKRFVPKVKFQPRTAGGGNGAPATVPGGGKQRALAELKKNPTDPKALESAIAAMMGG